jgi:TetR/AcrR family tetracycline transcriptional repressor
MTGSKRGPRHRRDAVTRDQIIDAAIPLLESGGVASLSMRKLAAELGVAPTTIYWHIGDRDKLLDAIAERIVSECQAITPRGETPPQRIASIARQIRRQVRIHPALIQLANQRGRGPAVSYPAQVALAREVTAAGLNAADTANAVWSILHLVGGFILLEGVLAEGHHRPSAGDLWRDDGAVGVPADLALRMSERPAADDAFEHLLAGLLRGLFEVGHPSRTPG